MPSIPGFTMVPNLEHTSNAMQVSRIVAAGTTNLTTPKSSPGRVYRILAQNLTATARFIHFYNHASPTVGSTAQLIAPVEIPPNTVNGGTVMLEFLLGLAFSVAISYSVTVGGLDTDTAVTTANDFILSVEYV